jgi:hypothetical protein
MTYLDYRDDDQGGYREDEADEDWDDQDESGPEGSQWLLREDWEPW